MPPFLEQYFKVTGPHALKRTMPIIAGLHLNEMPWDLPPVLKKRIVERLEKTSFNRYPEAYGDSLAVKLADWYGCTPGQVIIGPGSSAFIRLLLTYFGLHMQGKLVITRPSFTYYEQFCRAFGIPYDTWELDENFQYDLTALAELPDYSVVFLTSPNNPTGNALTTDQATSLLRQHPRSLFVIDEAYIEFTKRAMLPLLNDFDNLILLRTMSKGFGVAGLRCGALIGQESLVDAVAGLQTPWQLTPFTIEAAKILLDFEQESHWLREHVQQLGAERDSLRQACMRVAGSAFTVYPSEGNFLLFKAATPQAHATFISTCESYLIHVADLNHSPRLERCTRVTIGTPEENRFFFNAFQEALKELGAAGKAS